MRGSSSLYDSTCLETLNSCRFGHGAAPQRVVPLNCRFQALYAKTRASPPVVVSDPSKTNLSKRSPRSKLSLSVGFHWSVSENAVNFGTTWLYVAYCPPLPTISHSHGPVPQVAAGAGRVLPLLTAPPKALE